MKKKEVKSKSKEPKVDLDLDSEKYMLSKEARLALMQADAFRIPALEELAKFQDALKNEVIATREALKSMTWKYSSQI